MCVTFTSTRDRLSRRACGQSREPLKESGELPPQFPPRYIAMKLLEEDSYIKDQLKHHPKYPEWEEGEQTGSAADQEPAG